MCIKCSSAGDRIRYDSEDVIVAGKVKRKKTLGQKVGALTKKTTAKGDELSASMRLKRKVLARHATGK